MSLSKGIGLGNLYAFVCKRFGERAWSQLIRDIPAELHAALEPPDPDQWYDSQVEARLSRAMCERFGGDDLSLAVESGWVSAERNHAERDRWFLALVDPRLAVLNMNLYWRREHDAGHWSSELVDDEVIARLHDWDVVEPARCLRQLGYLSRLLEFFGPVTSPRHPLCRAGGAPYCEFRAHWQFSGAPLTAGDISSSRGLLDGLRVIAGGGDMAVLADALCDLLALMFSASRVRLRCRGPGGAVIERAHGDEVEPGSNFRRFAITHGEQLFGQLEVHTPGDLSADRRGFLDEILSWAGVLFDACHGSALHKKNRAAVQPPARDIEERLARAVDAFGLTRREREVLSWVVQGFSNKEIAASLSIREGTVEAHMTQLLRKSNMVSRTGLVAWFWADS